MASTQGGRIGWPMDEDMRRGVRHFHACDRNDNIACEPLLALGASCEEPNEGSPLCSVCITVIRENPAGSMGRTT